MRNKAFEALARVSDETGMPEAFKDDLLVHDCNRLTGHNAPEIFGWVLRKCGTLLLDATMSHPSRLGYAEHLMVSAPSASDRFYFWDGVRLIECSDARDMFARMKPHAANGPARY